MAVNGWFPALNGRGEVASGAGEVYFGDRLVGPGHHPKWVDDDTIVYDAGAELGSILLNVRNGLVRSVHPNANAYAAGGGEFLALWQGHPVTLRRYRATALLLDTRENCGPMAMAPNGRYVYADRFSALEHTLWIHELGAPAPVPFFTGPTMNLSIADRVVCWQIATGVRTTAVYGLRIGAPAIENWSIFEWEDPVACDGPDGPWVLSATQTGLILRPAGARVGYQWTGDYRNPAIRFVRGVFQIASSDGHGVPQPLTVDPATPRVMLQPPVIVVPPPPPPEPIGPRSPARPADGRVYDLLTYILGEPGTWPRRGPTHAMNQVISGSRVHFVKFGDIVPSGEAHETWEFDANWIYHRLDASGNPIYSFADPRWYPRHMAIGHAAAFDTGEYLTTFRDRATCRVLLTEPYRRRMWVESIYDRFYWGPDLGERETLVAVYDPTAGIHRADRFVELYYFAKGAGWVRWESHRSDLVYAHGAPVFGVPAARSDFYLTGGPNTQPKLTGCVPSTAPGWPPLKPIPVPVEDDMVAYGLPIVGFNLGDLVENGDGSVSVKMSAALPTPDGSLGEWLCVTPEGKVEGRHGPGGPWESFKRSGNSLVAVRGDRVYVLPLMDAD